MQTKFNLFENKKEYILDSFGNPMIFYHGSQNIFTIFKARNDIRSYGEIYFTDNLDNANDYGHIIYEVNLIINNPLILNAEDSYFDDFFYIMDKNIREVSNSSEYDGVIIKNLKDTRDGKPMNDYEYPSSNIYVVFNNNQIKIL
jgi:hypothetical protein